MRSQIKLGRIGGIVIGLHYSWFIIAILIAFSLAAHFHDVRPEWNITATWAAAIITAVLFFVTLLLHELAHSLVAKSRGLRVREITLFALGGVSQIESEASDAKSEFWIAIVGPLTSLVIGFLLLGIVRVVGYVPGQEPANPWVAVLLWLGYINIALAAFNMIPGFPLDGGRVLRAVIWWFNKNGERATRLAAQVGQAVALLFIVFGLYRFFVGANFGGLWLAFIGWFLLDAARSSYLQVGLTAGLRGQRVADIMERDCATVEGYLSIRDFVEQRLLHSSGRCFVVMQDHHAVGLMTANEAKKVNREDWDQTSVQSVMRPLNHMPTVSPDMPALKALELMSSEHADELAVVSEGKLEGVFSRTQVLRFLQMYPGIGGLARHHPA
ncbi:MAG TPA: site-2 protease family protein [Verrucomicrobiae bacterium]|jgi:Zn-dependent protease|nr:site-2 protease family protein [Verrucomicrobiae bacterium]